MYSDARSFHVNDNHVLDYRRFNPFIFVLYFLYGTENILIIRSFYHLLFKHYPNLGEADPGGLGDCPQEIHNLVNQSNGNLLFPEKKQKALAVRGILIVKPVHSFPEG
jgi:hypothetical protein